MKLRFKMSAMTMLLLLTLSHSSAALAVPPPLPVLPIPNAFQLQWQLSNMALFFHFGLNTFTGDEWGSGKVDPTVFNPTRLNAAQWIAATKDSGFSHVVLTAKHHDGFCLWPSQYTDYSVHSATGWKGGKGNVVKELVSAARGADIGFGIYLSPWDRHEPSYGDTLRYNEFYMGQLTELLTRYGEIKYVFLDGAKGEGEKDMEYNFESWYSLIHQHQPAATIFSRDVRWVGNENGVAGSTCWSLYNISKSTNPGEGNPLANEWVPAECDVSIRPGWFWHSSQHPKSAKELLKIYYTSVGRNCRLLLNVPPNPSGLISDEDIKVLKEFNKLKSSIFSHNLVAKAFVSASSTRGGDHDPRFSPDNVLKEGINTYWAPEEKQSKWTLDIDLQAAVSFNVLQLQEPIHMGQRVSKFHLEAWQNGVWKRVTSGTTIGYQRLLLFSVIKCQHLRLVVDKSLADPLISYLGIYMDSVTSLSDIDETTLVGHFNGSQVIRSTTHNNSYSAAM